MRKILLGALLCSFMQVSAQDYNKWSVDLGFGAHRPIFPFNSGYRTNRVDFWQGNVGARYMMNEKFGIRADVGYNKFTEGNNSAPFETSFLRFTVEGVLNAGNLFKFNDWTSKVNLLLHGGAGIGQFTSDAVYKEDNVIDFVLGATTQFKLTEKVAFFVDASAVMNMLQQTTFDMTSTKSGLAGLVQASVGLNIYLGKEAQHADWYSAEDNLASDIDALESRVKATEDGLAALKEKSNSMSFDKGALVSELDNRYYAKSGDNSMNIQVSNSNFIKDLLNKGYVNVYFDLGKSSVQRGSTSAINYLKQYLADNPSAKAELIGYADETGQAGYNQKLSERRAKTVYDILVSSGVDASRLSFKGEGEDASVNKSKQFARRVTFRIK